MSEQNIRRGDIFLANLDPVIGSEQGGKRPVLIIQNNRGNRYSSTVIIAAVTSKPKRKIPIHVFLRAGSGLKRDSVVLLEQIRTIDKKRLEEYVGTLDKRKMREVDKALCVSEGISRCSKSSLRKR